MKAGKLLAAAGLALLLPCAAKAQDREVRLGPSLTEFNLAGSIQFDPSVQTVLLRWAPFVSSNFQWGIDFTLAKAPGIKTSGLVGILGNYYLNSEDPGPGKWYVGAFAGARYGINDDAVLGLQGGVKYFTSANTAVTGELQWRTSDSADTTNLLIGLSFIPSGGVFSRVDPITMPTPGMYEYNIAANFGFDPETQAVLVRWAPFVTEAFQWGIDFTLLKVPGTKTSGIVGLIGNYYFPGQTSGSSRFYAGGAIGARYGVNDDTVWGLQAGLKHFLRSDVALGGELQWRTDNNNDTTVLLFGLSFFR